MKLRALLRLWGGSALLLLPSVAGAAGPQPVDSLSLHSRARRAQADFESVRAAHAPIFQGASAGSCDEVIGRMCLRYLSGLPDDWVPPEEHPRVVAEREELLAILDMVGDSLPGDLWVLGQHIAYLGELPDWERAHELSLQCRTPGWWCAALRGTALHFLGAIEEAGLAFADAKREMPRDVLSRWEEVSPLVELALVERFADIPVDSFARLRERIWFLSDPLFLLPGNDVRSAHDARQTLAAIRGEGDNAYGFRWGEDLHEIFVRYGPEVAYQQVGPPRPGVYPIPLVGRFDPLARGFLPTDSQVSAPERVPPGSWSTDDRAVRSRYTPAGASRIGLLAVQQARFRRGDDLFLVLGWGISEASLPWEIPADTSESNGEGEGESGGDRGEAGEREAGRSEPLQAALFLLPVEEVWDLEGGRHPVPIVMEEGGAPHGVVTLESEPGGYLVSLELHDAEHDRGWRARHGVSLAPLPAGVPGLSDLLLLSPGGAPAEIDGPSDSGGDSLSQHLSRVLPSLLLESDSVEVAWEVYGVDPLAGPVRFSLTVSSEERGAFRRALEFLRLARARSGAELSWEEEAGGGAGESSGTPHFRRITIDLSGLPEGRGTIRLGMQLPGREEVSSEATFEKVAPPR